MLSTVATGRRRGRRRAGRRATGRGRGAGAPPAVHRAHVRADLGGHAAAAARRPARLRADEERPALAVLVEDDEAARVLAEAVAPYRPGVPVGYFPCRGVEWGSGLEPAPHVAGERARALDVLARGGIVAVSAPAMAERLEPRERRPASVVVRRGDELERDDLVARLVAAGYERVPGTVEERGQLSARGDVVDVFPSTGREPLRFELFGDEIERVSVFSVAHAALAARPRRGARCTPPREAPDAGTGTLYHDDDGAPHVPEGLGRWPRSCRRRRVVAWQPAMVAAARSASAWARRTAVAAAQPRLPARGGRARHGRARARARRAAAGPAGHVRGPARRRSPRAAWRRPRTSCAAWSPRGCGCSSPSRTAARRSARSRTCAASKAALLEPGDALPASPACTSSSRGCAAAWSCAGPGGRGAAVGRRSSAGRGRQARRRSVGRAIATRSPTCAPATTSCTRTTASARFAGFDTKTVAGVTRDYL